MRKYYTKITMKHDGAVWFASSVLVNPTDTIEKAIKKLNKVNANIASYEEASVEEYKNYYNAIKSI